MSVLAATFAFLILASAVDTAAVAEAVVLPPKTPEISIVGGGSVGPRTDYVRLTYVYPSGESAPSAEVPNVVPGGGLTRVESPEAASGALGYNVYAVQNNGDTDSGHTLQNAAPIAFGTPFVEPPLGWRTDGKPLASQSETRTIEAVSNAGASIAVPRTPSIGGNVVLPRNDASPQAVVTISSEAATASAPATISFTFDRDVHFISLPSFYLFATKDAAADDPALLRFRDATADREIAMLDKYAIFDATFLGAAWHDGAAPAFDAIAGHRYEASLLTNPVSMLRIDTAKQQAFALPAAAGVRAEVRVPPLSAGGGAMLLRTSTSPGLGVPPLAGAGVGETVFYATIINRVNAYYDGDASLVVHLPQETCRNRAFSLAGYDSSAWRRGWMLALVRGRCAPSSDDVTFSTDLHDVKLFRREYVIAMYAQRETPRVAPSPALRVEKRLPAPPQIALLGDSTTVVTLIPPSAPGCSLRIEPSPACQFVFEPYENYGAEAARLAGYLCINLSIIGEETVSDSFVGLGVVELEVPQIPPETSVVVVGSGTLDLSEGDSYEDRSSRLDLLTNAVHAFVPHARIVFIGVRYFGDAATTPALRATIDAWDDREATLGKRYGAFLDARPLLPAGRSRLTPDGSHLTIGAQTIIAHSLAEILKSFVART